MKKLLLVAVLMLVSGFVWAQSCPLGTQFDDCSGPQFGPSGCVPGCAIRLCPVGEIFENCEGTRTGPNSCTIGCIKDPSVTELPGVVPSNPVGPSEVCLGAAGCVSVNYNFDNDFMFAWSYMPNTRYKVTGFAGPCQKNITQCPDISNQAHSDLRTRMLQLNRFENRTY